MARKNKDLIIEYYRFKRINYPWLGSYYNAKNRCNNPNFKQYKDYGGRGIKFLLTKKEIEKLWFRDKAYKMKRHSIDRKDNDGNYTFENCQFIELGENVAERNTRVCSKSVNQFDLKGNFIKTWKNTMIIEKQLGFIHGHISDVCLGKLKTSRGYIWEFTK